jgi:beta-lactamase superfamily II metal-dependent hydrolase
MSLVTAVAFGQIRLLFMADAEGGWMKDLCYQGYELGCNIIKFPCHGKWQKHVPTLLALSLPQYAIITDSDKNPADVKTLDALQTLDITTLRTADGDVHLFTDGMTVSMP